jgi:hypothetical protein
MLRIRKGQKATFAEHAATSFPERLRAALLNKLPEQRGILSGRDGINLIASRIHVARTRGFVGERDVARFVALGFVLGEGFAEEPWATSIFANVSLSTPTDRIEALWAMAEQRELDQAAESMARALGGKAGVK